MAAGIMIFVEISQKDQPRLALHTVFLDRDGVINRKLPEGRYVTSWSEFDLLPGVPDAICRLNSAGLRVLVVTNQRGIALGLYTAEAVHQIHFQFRKLLTSHSASVDGVYFCPHDRSECDCRKPLPGLFAQAVADFPDITAATSIMIGDSLSDIQFGRDLGMRTIYLQGDTSRQKQGASLASELADMRYPSLPEAVDSLLEELQPWSDEAIRQAPIR